MFEEMCQKFGYVYKNNILLFYTGPFSNWYGYFKNQSSPIKCEIQVNAMEEFEEIEWNCSEQLYMAYKAELFADWTTLAAIIEAKHPKVQKELGRTVANFNAEAWDSCKYPCMLNAVINKFRQNEHLQDFLKSVPKHAIIAEASPIDNVWGIGLAVNDERALDVRNWTGENLLGRALMEAKSEY